MELAWEYWREALNACRDTNHIAVLAYQLEPMCPSQEAWGEFCKAVIDLNWSDEMIEDAIAFAQDKSHVEHALYDNYFDQAIKLVLGDADRSMPAITWAAFNKHTYKGHADECAVVRLLVWAGFDANAGDDDSQTPLHFMAQMEVHPGSHPRAVEVLLQAGANPNARRRNGDSPLTALCGNMEWTEEADTTARLLLRAGADPRQTSDDEADVFSGPSTSSSPKKIGQWPIHHTLPPDDLKHAVVVTSVIIHLRSEDGARAKWLWRSDLDTLQESDDGATWKPCNDLSNLGIEPLDLQLSLLAPMIFGRKTVEKADETRQLLQLMLGYDDLVSVGTLAGQIGINRTALETAETKGLAERTAKIAVAIAGLPSELDDNCPVSSLLKIAAF
jgi:hypothetical protein